MLIYSLILLVTTAARVYSSFADHYYRVSFAIRKPFKFLANLNDLNLTETILFPNDVQAFVDEDAEHTSSTFLAYQSVNLALALLFFVLNCCKDSKLPTDKVGYPVSS